MVSHTRKGFTRRTFMGSVGALGGMALSGHLCQRPLLAGTFDATARLDRVCHGAPKPQVAIGACSDYGCERVESVLRDMVARLGGLGDVIHSGDTVVIKANLTGGGLQPAPDGLPSIMTYVTHPDVVRAIALLSLEAGARRVMLAEAQPESVWEHNGYGAVFDELEVERLNLAYPAPRGWYTRVLVPSGQALAEVWMNDEAAKADVYISVSKLKCHANAGITLSMKNSIACLPTELYRTNESDGSRTALHAGNWSERLPKIIVDLAKARPIDFCVIDGISTMEQGEGPWNQGQAGINLKTIRPELLIAGRNPVAVDAIGAACMGFDPEASPFSDGFLSGWNHLALAADAGIGPNSLEQIDVVGLPVAQVVYPFAPCPNQSGTEPTATCTATSTCTPTPSPTAVVQHAWLPLLRRE